MTKEDFENINELLKEYTNTSSFIKDYILRFRFADIATHNRTNNSSISGTNYQTTEEVSKIYKEAADSIIEEYNEAVKSICDKDHIKTQCENDNLLGLKTELDEVKKFYMGKIIDQYQHIERFPYTSGASSDYMLYDMYMDYITSDEFVYDKNNPYVVELVYDITSFLNMRVKVEKNASNIKSLISEFNILCDSTISQYWSVNKKDYYSHIKELFRYDFYENNDNELIQAKIDDKNRVTLYSKVLDYLKTTTRYTQPQSAQDKYKNADPETLINGGDVQSSPEETENSEKLSKLKKIALQFTYLRKIESDMDPNMFSEFISEKDMNDIFTVTEILDSMDMTIKDFNLACTIDDRLLNYSDAINKYMGSLKGMTANESRILRKLTDKAIDWYNKNASQVDDGTIFDRFKEINWPAPSIVHKDNEPLDFYYIEDKDETDDRNNNGTPDDGYEYTEDSLISQYGVDSYNYWLKYFTVATIVNCMIPVYWSTGLIVSGAPVMLPIIMIPFYAFSGRVTVVMGLGICGICPLPMIYFVNMGDLPGFMIPMLNTIVDVMKDIPKKIMTAGEKGLEESIKKMIEANDKAINEKKKQLDELEKDIANLQNGIEEDKETLRNMKKRLGKDPTSHNEKSEDH